MAKITKHRIQDDIKRFCIVLFASFVFALDIKIFVRVGNLFPGGITGVSVLIQRLFGEYLGIEVPYTPINIALNVIPAYIGFRFIGKRFTFFSVAMIILNSIFVDALPVMVVTYDPLLIAIFGGLISGFAIAMCLHADATSGGTDFIAIYLSQKRGMDSFNIILGFNIILLAVAGFLFGWDKALYSIVFQYVSTQVIHVLYRAYQHETLFIITDKPAEVCKLIFELAHHGATTINGKGSYDNENRTMVYSIVSASQCGTLIPAIKELDEHAFINSVRSSQIYGNFYLRPRD